MEFFLAWIVCAFICAFVASSKGRSFVGWFLLGLLLPIVSLLALIAVPSLRAPAYIEKEQRQAARDSKKCPECAEIVRRDAKVCRFCGHRFDPERLIYSDGIIAKKSYKGISYTLYDDRHVEADVNDRLMKWPNTTAFKGYIDTIR
ncbi:zinc ribbon domain-containing protein [Chelatococcus sp.]|uniref:zinc ribbon domain-containing protein n=1 Tax=Chelatococcus sp. TaxID=1953771 RepID=UPI001EC4CF6B|nr:zinc ribbon domain-containing protein [Chelatococcus sp.]MBX3543578.1 zinc ribbon domain-containing protein [Chelatococcus sp.]